MREYFDLSDCFYEKLFEGGKKNLSLPLVVPFENAPEEFSAEYIFTPPPETEGNCFFLELHRLSGSFDIYLNGEKLSSHKSMYSRVCIELTDTLCHGRENTIRVCVKPLKTHDGKFTFGKAAIIMTGKTHFELVSHGETALNIRSVLNGDSAHISVKASIVNSNNYDVAVFTLFDGKGRALETRTEKPTCAKTDFILPAPELWDGPHSPAMYRIEAKIQRDYSVSDCISMSFGIRSFEISKEGFFCVNGLKSPINAVRLTDFSAIHDDFESIKELEANCVIFNGLPVDDDILTRCDEAGLLAWLELPHKEWEASLNEAGYAAELSVEHPSLALIGSDIKEPTQAKNWCREIKSHSQYTLCALRSDIMESESITDAIPDVLTVAVPSALAPSDFLKLETKLRELNALHPDFRLAVWADSPECIFDRHTGSSTKNDCSQEYFSAWHEKFWETFCSEKSVIGVAVGCLSDRSEKTGRQGLITFDREDKKDAFWFYKAQFSATDFVKLCSSSQTLVTAKYTDIKCYSNSPAVNLTLNGKDCGKRYSSKKLSDCIYVFKDVKLKRKNNTVVVTSANGTDSEVIFRSRSRLSKK